MRQLLAFILLFFIPLTIVGCNTIKGVGEDITGSAMFMQHKLSGDGAVSSNDSGNSGKQVNSPPWPGDESAD